MSKALKALESIRERVNTNEYGFYDHDAKSDAECDVIEKALKALEIIKEKGLSTNDIAFIKSGDSWETYAETMKELCWGDEHLDEVLKTQDEYDLLKEVLWED